MDPAGRTDRPGVLTDRSMALLIRVGCPQSLDHILDFVAVRSFGSQPQIGLIVVEGTLVVTLFDKGISEIKMGPGIVGGRVEGSFILSYFAGRVTLFAKKQSEIEMSLGVILLNLDCLPVFEDRSVEISALGQQDSQIVMSLGVARVEPYCFAVMSLSSR